jgi:hypothetical protein
VRAACVRGLQESPGCVPRMSPRGPHRGPPEGFVRVPRSSGSTIGQPCVHCKTHIIFSTTLALPLNVTTACNLGGLTQGDPSRPSCALRVGICIRRTWMLMGPWHVRVLRHAFRSNQIKHKQRLRDLCRDVLLGPSRKPISSLRSCAHLLATFPASCAQHMSQAGIPREDTDFPEGPGSTPRKRSRKHQV